MKLYAVYGLDGDLVRPPETTESKAWNRVARFIGMSVDELKDRRGYTCEEVEIVRKGERDASEKE